MLLSGPTNSAGRPMPDGRRPGPGGWNRIHLIVEDLSAEENRLRAAGVHFRNDIVSGPGGLQILVEDPSGNVVELFQPARVFHRGGKPILDLRGAWRKASASAGVPGRIPHDFRRTAVRNLLGKVALFGP